MVEALVHIITTVISGCVVTLFTQWLRTRNNKKK
ncbi:type I toxin-antitoxin system Fst family toxin [Staphylococcus caledonicus]|nr:type I toxin-antitoxin system Fst family toxin [Staphylococcus caledonicus]MBI5972872.1 type I toxin-antitoxin system Fst family toxin [Staphylococcus caledonicus]